MKETILIIGATSGIGLAASELLAKEGYRLIISGRTPDSIERALKQIGNEATGFPLDFTNPDSVGEFFSHVGSFDHLALVGSGQAAWDRFANSSLTPCGSRLIRNSTASFSVSKRDLRSSRKRAPSPS